jgi:choline monooxygenase
VNGLLFVNLDDAPLPFAQEGPAFEPQLSAFLPDLRCFARAHRSVFRIKANWKAVVDNFSETYHAPVAHRRLVNVEELEGFRPQHHRRFTYFASKSGTGDTSFAVKPGEDYPTWTLWPNLCLLSLPGSRNLVVMRMQPDGPEGCLEQVDFYVDASADRAPPEALRQAIRFFDESLNPEDIALVESVQRGLNSRAYSQGRYVVDAADSWFSESALHHFHKQVVEAVLKT